MLAQGGGSIINTASSLGQVAIAHQSAYVTSKHGVIGMTRNKGEANSADSQFFIALGRAPNLDSKYTVIGQVIEGMHLLDQLQPGQRLRC